MPIYIYAGVCGHKFELAQKITAPAICECVVCGKYVERVIHPATVVFNGTGWSN